MNRILWALIVMHAVVLGGCASQQNVASPEAAVALRAKMRWEALVKKDYAETYAMLSPSARMLMTKENYVSKAGLVTWLNAEVQSVECGTADLCEVKVKARYAHMVRHIGSVQNDQYIRELWRKVGDDWWYVPADN